MNVGISVSVFNAPGLRMVRKRAIRDVEGLFRGQNFMMSLDPNVPLEYLNLLTLVANAANIPAESLPSLMFLRIMLNNKELDITKSLKDNGVTQYVLLQVHLIGK